MVLALYALSITVGRTNEDYPKRLFAAITLLWEMVANNPKRPNVSEGAKGKLRETGGRKVTGLKVKSLRSPDRKRRQRKEAYP